MAQLLNAYKGYSNLLCGHTAGMPTPPNEPTNASDPWTICAELSRWKWYCQTSSFCGWKSTPEWMVNNSASLGAEHHNYSASYKLIFTELNLLQFLGVQMHGRRPHNRNPKISLDSKPGTSQNSCSTINKYIYMHPNPRINTIYYKKVSKLIASSFCLDWQQKLMLQLEAAISNWSNLDSSCCIWRQSLAISILLPLSR